MRTRKATCARERDVFAAIGDPTRRRVLDLLLQRSLAAGEIAAHFKVSRPAISQHLHVLRRAKLVAVQRRGREHIYRLNAAPLQEAHDWIEHYAKFWEVKMSALGGYLDRTSGGKN